jgi:phosphoribosylanthranilate isomerase
MGGMNVFAIKICGVTSPLDAEVVAAAGPDAVGLNFCSDSPRYVSLEAAESIDRALPAEIARVAVVVNAELDEVRRMTEHLRIDYLQLHGDETPTLVAAFRRQFPTLPLIRAFRCRDQELDHVELFVRQCEEIGADLAAILVDAYQPGQYGGTGKTVDWESLAERPELLRRYPLVLAGGLRPNNVGEAIWIVQPAAVDTASGVELTPGRKDQGMVESFVRAAREALDALRAT